MLKNRGTGVFSIHVITYTAMLTALQIVLGNLLQIPLLGKQYNLGLIPIVTAAMLMGPVPAAIVGGLGDFIGAHLFPAGTYFPGFTLTNVLVGLLCGLLVHRRGRSAVRVIAAVAGSLLINWLLNSLWLTILAYVPGRGYLMWVSVRAINYPVELVVNGALGILVGVMLARVDHLLPADMRQAERKKVL